MAHKHDKKCKCTTSKATSLYGQTLEEIEFERSIHYSCLIGNEKKVLKIINSSKEPQKLVNSKDAYGYSPIHYAAKNSHLEICKMLIANGALIDAQAGSLKTTALHRAALDKDKSMIQFLLENGASLDIVDDLGRIPRELLD